MCVCVRMCVCVCVCVCVLNIIHESCTIYQKYKNMDTYGCVCVYVINYD